MKKTRVEVIIHTMDLTNEEEFKVEQARLKIERVLNIEEFRYFVLGFSWERVTTTGHLWWKKYYKQEVHHFASTLFTNQQVYNHIMSGRDAFDQSDDFTLEVEFRIDRHNKRGVLGYTFKNVRTVWQYINFFKNATVDEIAGNLIHEILHNMQFEHDYRPTQRRPSSVNYAIGYFIRDF